MSNTCYRRSDRNFVAISLAFIVIGYAWIGKSSISVVPVLIGVVLILSIFRFRQGMVRSICWSDATALITVDYFHSWARPRKLSVKRDEIQLELKKVRVTRNTIGDEIYLRIDNMPFRLRIDPGFWPQEEVLEIYHQLKDMGSK